jgi:hypothetical protein
LLFIPSSGPHAGVTHIVQVKHSKSKVLVSSIALRIFTWFARIAEANPDSPMRFALVTNSTLDRRFLSIPLPENVQVIERVRGERDWVPALQRWVGAE